MKQLDLYSKIGLTYLRPHNFYQIPLKHEKQYHGIYYRFHNIESSSNLYYKFIISQFGCIYKNQEQHIQESARMSPYIDNRKFIQLGIGIFGIYSICIIYSVIYERLIMSTYENDRTNQKQFFVSASGFVLLQKGICWLLIQACGLFFFTTQPKVAKIPKINSLACGILVFLSSTLFTQGIYYTSYRLSFAIKTGTFVAASLLGLMFSPSKDAQNRPKIKDIFLGLSLVGGAVLFWVYDPELCFYIPVMPGVISIILIVVSAICEGVLSICQAQIKQVYKPKSTQMFRSIARFAFLSSLIYAGLTKQIYYTFEFCANHSSFLFDVLVLSSLAFIAQLFIYRVVNNLAQNVSPLISSSKKILAIQISYLLSVHSYHKYQIVGMILAWVTILGQAFYVIKNDSKSQQVYKLSKKQYRQVPEVISDDL